MIARAAARLHCLHYFLRDGLATSRSIVDARKALVMRELVLGIAPENRG